MAIFFKVLKGQGRAAPLREMNFVVKDVIGVVSQKDLGPNTLELAATIDRFNPDKSWIPVLENQEKSISSQSTGFRKKERTHE